MVQLVMAKTCAWCSSGEESADGCVGAVDAAAAAVGTTAPLAHEVVLAVHGHLSGKDAPATVAVREVDAHRRQELLLSVRVGPRGGGAEAAEKPRSSCGRGLG